MSVVCSFSGGSTHPEAQRNDNCQSRRPYAIIPLAYEDSERWQRGKRDDEGNHITCELVVLSHGTGIVDDRHFKGILASCLSGASVLGKVSDSSEKQSAVCGGISN